MKEKKNYIKPEIKVVEFKTEIGFFGSEHPGKHGHDHNHGDHPHIHPHNPHNGGYFGEDVF